MARRQLALATALILVAGCAAGTGTSMSVGRSAPPSIQPTALAPSSSAAYLCSDQTVGCAGQLAAGSHHTVAFERPFSFTVGDGWTNDRDIYRAYILQSAAAPDAEFIVWTRSAPAEQTADCSPARRPGFGTSVAEWLRSLRTDDRLLITKTETFDLGRHHATRVELSTRAGFAAMCPFNTDPFAVIVTDTENPPTRHHGGSGPMSITLIDFGDDSVLIWNDGGSVGTARMVELSLPVIHSIRFDN